MKKLLTLTGYVLLAVCVVYINVSITRAIAKPRQELRVQAERIEALETKVLALETKIDDMQNDPVATIKDSIANSLDGLAKSLRSTPEPLVVVPSTPSVESSSLVPPVPFAPTPTN